jgi:hypothetical protein
MSFPSSPGIAPQPFAPAGHPLQNVVESLFGNSEPGAAIHHLALVQRLPNALGLPAPHTMLYAIAPVGPEVDPEEFIALTIARACREATAKGPVWGAVLALELNSVQVPRNDEVAENRARRMRGDHQLHTHPGCYEATWLYAACADGRRWWGLHRLTGPQAGSITGPLQLQGPPQDGDRMPHARTLRAVVGLPF